MEIHVIENFKIKLLIKTNVLMFQDMIYDLGLQQFIIANCKNTQIFINFRIRNFPNIQKIIRARQFHIILLNEKKKFSSFFLGGIHFGP